MAMRSSWGGIDVKTGRLLFVDLRVIARRRVGCERIASEMRASGGEKTWWSAAHGPSWHARPIRAARQRGEGNQLSSLQKESSRRTELDAWEACPRS